MTPVTWTRLSPNGTSLLYGLIVGTIAFAIGLWARRGASATARRLSVDAQPHMESTAPGVFWLLLVPGLGLAGMIAGVA